MIKKVLAGAALATAATMAVAVPASADTGNFGTSNGETAISGASGGILNNHGAPLGGVDLRCAVPMPEGEGIGGHGLSGLKNECQVAPVNQFLAPQKLL